MNLPLEYNKLSAYYDALSSGDKNARNRIVEKVLKKYKIKTVLDLTCGTGSQVLWLTKHGYKVTGSDFSSYLLKIAKNKALEQKISVHAEPVEARHQASTSSARTVGGYFESLCEAPQTPVRLFRLSLPLR